MTKSIADLHEELERRMIEAGIQYLLAEAYAARTAGLIDSVKEFDEMVMDQRFVEDADDPRITRTAIDAARMRAAGFEWPGGENDG